MHRSSVLEQKYDTLPIEKIQLKVLKFCLVFINQQLIML